MHRSGADAGSSRQGARGGLKRALAIGPYWVLRRALLHAFKRHNQRSLESGERMLTVALADGGVSWFVSDRALYVHARGERGQRAAGSAAVLRVPNADVVGLDAPADLGPRKAPLTLKYRNAAGREMAVSHEFTQAERGRLLRTLGPRIDVA